MMMTSNEKPANILQILERGPMKSQKHNQGELKEVTVKIENQVALDLELMSKNTGMPVADIVVIALKRFRSSHLDYMKLVPMTE